MEFNIKQYIAAMFIFELSIICIFIIIIVFQIILSLYLKQFKTNTFLTLLLLCVILTLYLILGSFSRGVKLLTEKKDDIVVIEGTIQGISNTIDRYTYENKTVFASYIYIDNEKYYIMYRGDLNIGDKITIYYYSKSKVILKVYR